jgi:hypothetical protein
MATALLDIGFLGAIAFLLWLAALQERWLERENRADRPSVPYRSAPSRPDSDHRRRRAA